MKNRISVLARQYENARHQYPDRKLMIVFDIDGTILDMRHMVDHVLKSFDQSHGTHFFDNLMLDGIPVHEGRIHTILDMLKIAPEDREKIVHWYNAYRWSVEEILRSHRPFAGMMDMIQWFHIQPHTFIGLNTSRPEISRLDTLRTLNKLGGAFKMHFNNNRIFMNPFGCEKSVPEVKAAGIEHFRKSGYHIFAMVDSDPMNLEAVSAIDTHREILLLNTDAVIDSRHNLQEIHTEAFREIVRKTMTADAPTQNHVQFAWNNITDKNSLSRFLNSGVRWAAFSAFLDPSTGKAVLRQDTHLKKTYNRNESFTYLHDLLDIFQTINRSVKIDLTQGSLLLDELFAMLAYYGFDGSRLWFNADVNMLGKQGIKRLKKHYPSAIVQCPVDGLIPNPLNISKTVDSRLKCLKKLGINRFSMKWHPENMAWFKAYFDDLGVALNIDDVPDLTALLKTILIMPQSITTDFNFSISGFAKGRKGVLPGRINDTVIQVPASA